MMRFDAETTFDSGMNRAVVDLEKQGLSTLTHTHRDAKNTSCFSCIIIWYACTGAKHWKVFLLYFDISTS